MEDENATVAVWRRFLHYRADENKHSVLYYTPRDKYVLVQSVFENLT